MGRVGGMGGAPARMYHENIIDHYENPRNVGSLDKKKANVGTGLVGAPACGDVMKLQVEVDDNGTITQAKFKTFGCGSAIASSSVATEWLQGRTVDECLEVIQTHHLSTPLRTHGTPSTPAVSTNSPSPLHDSTSTSASTCTPTY